MQLDLPPRRSWPFLRDPVLRDPVLRDPVLRDPGVVIARGVEKNMDQRRQWIERLDRFQQLDRQRAPAVWASIIRGCPVSRSMAP